MFELLFYPDSRLSQPAEEVTSFDQTLRESVGTLFRLMREAKGVGLSACHMGDLRRYIVLDLPPPDHTGMPLVCVNPRIIFASDDMHEAREGSVSMPGVSESVRRHSFIRIVYQDLDGASHHREASGFLSACLQHEIDQLDGLFWIFRLSRLKRERLLKKYSKHNGSVRTS
jgi:peptide deformylase